MFNVYVSYRALQAVIIIDYYAVISINIHNVAYKISWAVLKAQSHVFNLLILYTKPWNPPNEWFDFEKMLHIVQPFNKVFLQYAFKIRAQVFPAIHHSV